MRVPGFPFVGAGVSIDAHEDFPARVNERLPQSLANATAALSRVGDQGSALEAAARHLKRAGEAKNAAATVHWIHRAADAWAAPVSKVAACGAGCSHCCHIPLSISRAEAGVIAAHAKRKLRANPDTRVPEPGYGNPCPFLKASRCSIYAVRPHACRTLFNLDRDALLCELVPGAKVPVPYANNRDLAIECQLRLDNDIADIRAWFPASG